MKASVLIVGNFFSSISHNPNVCELLAAQLKARDWRVIKTSTYKNKILRMLDMIGTTIRQKRNYGIGIVEVYSGWAFLWAEIVSKVLSVLHKPYILVLHGGNLPKFSKRNLFRVKAVFNKAAKVISPSEYLKKEMTFIRSDIQVVPNAISLNAYPSHIRNSPTPKLVWVRAFHEIYNPSLAIQVIKALKVDFPQIELTMIGPDKKDGSLKKTIALAKSLRVENNITFVGSILKSEIPRFLKNANIFINTANFDNTPVSIIEAMACGLCIVSTDVGGIPYLLEHEGEALLVSPDSPEDMAKAVKRILQDSKLSQKISTGARAKAELFDQKVIMRQWESLLEQALAEQKNSVKA